MLDDKKLEAVQKKIQEDILAHRVVLYMKGTRQMPQCGFSAKVVQILDNNGMDYQTYNVLEDDHLRQGIKNFSDWPTIPQLYVDSKFIGGCDIIMEMEQSGELNKILDPS